MFMIAQVELQINWSSGLLLLLLCPLAFLFTGLAAIEMVFYYYIQRSSLPRHGFLWDIINYLEEAGQSFWAAYSM